MKQPLVYILYSFVLFCLLQNCTRNGNDTNPPDGDTTKPKRRLLTMVDGSSPSNDSPTFNYDSSGKLIRIAFSFAHGQIDVHHSADTISYLIFPFRDINSAQMAAAAIFYYRPDKKIERVIYTSAFPQGTEVTAIAAAKAAYYVSPGGPVRSVDSIVYTATGQLSEIWTLRNRAPNYYVKFVYNNPSQKSPSRIQQSDVNHVLSSDMVLTTNNMESEAYKACWFLPFIYELMFPYVYGGLAMPITPHITNALLFAWALVPNCIIQYTETSANSGYAQGYTSPVFTYEYSQDSLTFEGHILGDVPGPFNRFRYFFELK